MRAFREHEQRRVKQLDGIWDFELLGDVETGKVKADELGFSDRMAVPGCFDAAPRYAGQRGLAAYRTRFRTDDAVPHRLWIDGLHHWGRVLVDRETVAEHIGGFTRFAVDLPGLQPGEHELIVLADNRIDYERCPLHLDYFDWYHFGGITRGVELHRLGRQWIDDLRLTTLDVAARRVRLELDWARTQNAPCTAPCTVTVNGELILEEALAMNETSGTLARELTLSDAQPWTPDQPALQVLHATLGEDDRRERFGLRTITCRGRELLLNGAPLRLLGFNRHESTDLGHTQPPAMLVRDVQLLKDMGCNFVRGSHYPQDQLFLDLCDENGLCVWCEAIGWQQTAEQLTDERFLSAQAAHIDEMVASARNHPSVIIWGILNESESDQPASRPGYERLLGRLRGKDPSRPVTYACNRPQNDVCLDLVDVVSLNTYPGWYSCEIEDIPRMLDKTIERLDQAGAADRPFIVSEIGGGAIYGCRDAFGFRWTEGYQDRLLDVVIRHLFMDRSRVCGLAIWQFCDGRTSEIPRRAMMRPRGFNNKGIVDEYRRPKQAYATVRRLFRELSANHAKKPDA